MAMTTMASTLGLQKGHAMSDPITFESTSPRFGLPLLFVGQSQKEAFVNEALSRLDGLIHCAIEAILTAPPTTPADGLAWLVAPSPTGDWAGRAGQLAMRQSGQWLFVVPRDGTRVLNKSNGQDFRYFSGAWTAAATPAQATGGSTIDTEARAMLANLVLALRQAGIFGT
jgi:hypothetical protein